MLSNRNTIPYPSIFNSGIGIDLQNIDSQIIEKVLLKFCGKRRLAALPMHDSLIVHHGMEQRLQKAMDEAFRERFGVSCKVELKYNSITERQKAREGEEDICELSLRELLDIRSSYGTYYHLLDTQQQRRMRTTSG